MKSTIPIGEFKTHCYKILDTAIATGESVIITRKGNEIVKISPINTATDENQCFFDMLKGSIAIKADIVLSLEVKWEVCDE